MVFDARVHYTILKPLPNTHHHTPEVSAAWWSGWSCWLKPHPHTLCAGFVIPGPNNVLVLAHPNHNADTAHTEPRCVDERKK